MSKKNRLSCSTARSAQPWLLSAMLLAPLPCLALVTTAQAARLTTTAPDADKKTPPESTQLAALNSDASSFNTAFLHGSVSAADLRTLLAGTGIAEGVQRVDLYVNQLRTGRRDITFSRNPGSGEVEPCFDLELLEQIGIELSQLPAAPVSDATCLRLPEIVPQATVSYESGQLRLNISVPQIYMSAGKRGYVDPSLWEAGQSAAFVNYNLNLRRDSEKGQSAYSQTSLDLRSGINIGDWRLRNNSHLSAGTGRSHSFTSQNTYLQRDLAGWKSQLLAGQTYTHSPIFNSVRFLGAQLLSDDAMRPDSEQGYAPVIRGMAESNATVEVRQNGYVIYTTNVAPGPFAITDLAPSGSNGDLEITIIEADGSRRTLRQAFSSPPLMVREGRVKYDLAAGQVRLNDEMRERPTFVGGSMLYGMTTNTTLAAAAQVSRGYQAYSLGLGLNTTLGAFSVDATHASSKIHDRQSRGASVNLRYAKYVEQTGSNISVNIQRDLNQGYKTLTDHVLDSEIAAGHSPRMLRGSRQRIDFNLSQALAGGSLYLNASYNKQWESGSSNSLSLGYSNSIGRLSYNLAYTHIRNLQSTRGASRSRDHAVMLTLSLPLGSGAYAPQGFANLNRDKSGSSMQAGATGMLPTEQEISYAVSAGRTTNHDTNASVAVGAATSFARLNASHSQGSRSSSSSFSAAGSIVVHEGGLNLGQSLGETVMLAKVDPPVPDVGISSHAGVKTGANGYAIIPNATPYRSNHVSLDTRGAPRNAEFDNSVQQVVPTRGAIAVATFKSQVGQRIQFELLDAEGAVLPFGAMVSDATGKQLGMTDPRGRILAMLPEEQSRGFLDVVRADTVCRAEYVLPEKLEYANYQRLTLRCIPRPARFESPSDLAIQTERSAQAS